MRQQRPRRLLEEPRAETDAYSDNASADHADDPSDHPVCVEGTNAQIVKLEKKLRLLELQKRTAE